MSDTRPDAPVMPALPPFAWAWIPSEVWKDWVVTVDPIAATDARQMVKVVTLVRESEAIAMAHTYAREYAASLRAALEKIADWDGNYGPFPEGNNEAWGSMAIVTAREAVPREGSNPTGRVPEGPRAKPDEPGPKDAPKGQEGAAPAEGVQPVAWMPSISLLYLAEDGGWSRVEGKRSGMFDTPLYAAPQAAGVPTQCNYPDCKCPVDAPPNWCARGLPARDSQAPAAPAAPVDALRDAFEREFTAPSRAPRDPADLRYQWYLAGWQAALSRPQAEQEPTCVAVLCGCGDQIVPDDAAKCGVCAMQDAEDAARLMWLERKLFERKWGGTLGVAHNWYIRGDYRHTTAALRGDTLREAIDAARAPQEGSQP